MTIDASRRSAMSSIMDDVENGWDSLRVITISESAGGAQYNILDWRVEMVAFWVIDDW